VTKLSHNVIANFSGQAWGLLMNLAFVPIYIRVLGIEAYGLIGFFLSLQAFFLILDMGLAATVNRELARSSLAADDADTNRDLVRTLELVYWPTGLLIALGVFLLSGSIASHWLKPVSLSMNQASQAIMLMGFAAALQWPFGLYAGGLRGLERQVALNTLNAFFATLRSVGAVGIILFYSPTLDAFLWWQVVVGAAQTLAAGSLLWRLLPEGSRAPSFVPDRLIEQRKFALGIAGIVAVSFLLTQSDRIVLSALLPLNEFGYYTLAATVAAAMSAVIGPFFNALYPRFSRLIAAGEEERLIALYHQSNQLAAVVVASSAAVLAFFANDVLRLWTHNDTVATHSGPLLSILVVGTALNGLMNLPYALQLAYGWTRLAFYQNLVAVMIVVPSTWWLGHRFGGIGAATVWVMLNLGYATIGIPLMHRRILRREMAKWYWRDILMPTVAAVTTAGILRMLLPPIPTNLYGIVALAAVGTATISISLLASPTSRCFARNTLISATKAYIRLWQK
jgi:O-antigen/teichoic acid export membrane protein